MMTSVVVSALVMSSFGTVSRSQSILEPDALRSAVQRESEERNVIVRGVDGVLASGFIIDNSGLIATTDRVTHEGGTVKVRLVGYRENHFRPASLVGLDSLHHIAILKIDGVVGAHLFNFLPPIFSSSNRRKRAGANRVRVLTSSDKSDEMGYQCARARYGTTGDLDCKHEKDYKILLLGGCTKNQHRSGGLVTDDEYNALAILAQKLDGRAAEAFAVPIEHVERLYSDVVAHNGVQDGARGEPDRISRECRRIVDPPRGREVAAPVQIFDGGMQVEVAASVVAAAGGDGGTQIDVAVSVVAGGDGGTQIDVVAPIVALTGTDGGVRDASTMPWDGATPVNAIGPARAEVRINGAVPADAMVQVFQCSHATSRNAPCRAWAFQSIRRVNEDEKVEVELPDDLSIGETFIVVRAEGFREQWRMLDRRSLKEPLVITFEALKPLHEWGVEVGAGYEATPIPSIGGWTTSHSGLVTIGAYLDLFLIPVGSFGVRTSTALGYREVPTIIEVPAIGETPAQALRGPDLDGASFEAEIQGYVRFRRILKGEIHLDLGLGVRFCFVPTFAVADPSTGIPTTFAIVGSARIQLPSWKGIPGFFIETKPAAGSFAAHTYRKEGEDLALLRSRALSGSLRLSAGIVLW